MKYEMNSPLKNQDKRYNFSVASIERYISKYSTYLEISDSIRTGDIKALTDALNKITMSQLAVYQLCDYDFVRSLKNGFIKACSIACYIAIDEKVSYENVMSITDNYISEMENLENIIDIYSLMKDALISIAVLIGKHQKNAYSKYVRKAMEYINSHYSEKITLEILAEYTKISTFYLSKQLKKETGLSLMNNVNKIRIERSKFFLKDINLSILDIAHKVGFTYQNHFAAIFKKFTGSSPTEFRKKLEKSHIYNKNKPFLM